MTIDSRAQLEKAISRRLDRHLDFLTALIRHPSVRGQERPAQDVVADHWSGLGLEVHAVPCRSDPGGINLAARHIGVDHGCQSLILNAHCDVTPVDQPERWLTPPFEPVVDNGILRGRGALDDKAGLAVISLAADVLIHELGTPLGGDLILQSVVEDETTGHGSHALVEAGWTADGVIICDGTWPERIIVGHLGQAWVDVTVRGEPVAAASARRGINPITLSQRLIADLEQFVGEQNRTIASYAGIEQPFLVNVGALHAGVWAGSVPASAEMKIQVSFPPPWLPDLILAEVQRRAAAISDRIEIRPGLLQAPPFSVAKSELVADLRNVIQKHASAPVLLMTVSGHCDMRHFQTPNVCLYGPGGGKNPHGIDEYYHLDHLPFVAANILEFTLDWCNRKR